MTSDSPAAVRARGLFLPKLVPPRRRGDTVRRERLLNMLSGALEYDVAVVSAPAGYGKSTLAVDWCAEAELPVAWLSLDRQDTDPLALVVNLVGAVRQAFPDALGDLEGRLAVGAAPRSAPALAAEFAGAVQQDVDSLFALVVDDLHALDDAGDAMAVIDALVRTVPMNLRLFLLSRTWPALGSIARLTAQRRALSIAAADLVFTREEAEAFLDQSAVTDAAARYSMIERADGWAAALAVMADHYTASQGNGRGGGLRFILAQFIDQEVLEYLGEEEAALLTACAVLPTFDLEFAQELSGQEQAGATLRVLEETNHFLTRLEDSEGGGEWYRMHALVREHLLQRLERERPSRLIELRRNAAAVCARRGLTSDAVELSIEASDWPGVVGELYALSESLYQRGEWSTLVGWLDRLPDQVLTHEVDLAITRARLAAKLSKGQECLSRLDSFDGRPLSPEQRVRTLLYRGIALRGIGQLVEALEACRHARQFALEQLDDDDSFFAEIDLEEGITLGRSGQFEPARERFSTAAARFEEQRDDHRTAEARDGLGITLYHLGSLAESMGEFTAAQRRWRMLAEPQAQIATMNNMGNVQHMLGELETARDTFNAVIERAGAIEHARYEAYGKEGLATVERDLGHLDNAITLYTIAIHEAQEIDDAALILEATYGLAMCYRERGEYAHARALLDHGLRSAEQSGALLQQAWFGTGVGATLLGEQSYAAAIPVLERAVEQADASGAPREAAIGLLLLAAACYHGRRRPQAAQHLQRVHEIATTLGYDQFLLAEARQVPEVVEYAAARRIGGEYFRALSGRFRDPSAAVEDVPGAFRIRAEAFGAPRVTVDGRAVADLEWRSERSKELFFYLLHRGRPLRKEEIALELWPDASPKQLNSAFHSTLYRLRRAIHPQVVVQSGGGYQVNPEFDISYDAREFEEGAAQADRAEPGSSAWADGLSRAVGLYRGPFAPTFESDWAEYERRRYEEIYLSSMLALSAAALRRGDSAEAVRMAESVIAVDPLNEDATYRAMEAHARRGHLERATRAYRRLSDALREEVGSTPSSRLRALYERVLSGEALGAEPDA
ncbi:MAG: BTAD domain-containing putative transcriptional regulator [Dehalococcoidia bacterium]